MLSLLLEKKAKGRNVSCDECVLILISFEA